MATFQNFLVKKKSQRAQTTYTTYNCPEIVACTIIGIVALLANYSNIKICPEFPTLLNCSARGHPGGVLRYSG